jgi:hypothetical protein
MLLVVSRKLTRAPGWDVGEAPDDIQGASAELLSVQSNPVLVFNYGIQTSPEGGVQINGGMRNVGDAPAENAQMVLQFQDSDGNPLTEARSSTKAIPVEEGANVNFTASPPDDQRQRVRAAVFLNGNLHDFITSGYREPE